MSTTDLEKQNYKSNRIFCYGISQAVGGVLHQQPRTCGVGENNDKGGNLFMLC